MHIYICYSLGRECFSFRYITVFLSQQLPASSFEIWRISLLPGTLLFSSNYSNSRTASLSMSSVSVPHQGNKTTFLCFWCQASKPKNVYSTSIFIIITNKTWLCVRIIVTGKYLSTEVFSVLCSLSSQSATLDVNWCVNRPFLQTSHLSCYICPRWCLLNVMHR